MKAFHQTFGQVEIIKEEEGKVTFVISETREEKTLISKFVNLYATEEDAVKAKELKEELKEIEENEEKETLRAEIAALEIEVRAIEAKNGGLTCHEVTARNIAKGIY